MAARISLTAARRCRDATAYQIASSLGVQALCRVIRLFRGRGVCRVDEFDPAPVDDLNLAVVDADDEECRPAGVSLQSEGDSHAAPPRMPRTTVFAMVDRVSSLGEDLCLVLCRSKGRRESASHSRIGPAGLGLESSVVLH